MKCQKVSFWRNYIDKDSPFSNKQKQVAEKHLSNCRNCQSIVNKLNDNYSFVSSVLDTSDTSVTSAWVRFTNTVKNNPKKDSNILLLNRKIALAISTLMAFILIAASTTQPVRTIAANILEIFRIEKFEPIAINYNAAMNFDPSVLGKFNFDDMLDEREPRNVKSFKEAAKITGLNISIPKQIPSNLKHVQITAIKPGKVSLTFNLKKFNSYLKKNNFNNINLPKNIDGKTIIGRIPPVVITEYCPSKNSKDTIKQLIIFQAGLPTIEAKSIDIDAVRNELLKLPVLPPEIKNQLLALDDWKRSLPIPYPSEDLNSEKVMVNNNKGIYFTTKNNKSAEAKILIWTDKNQSYGIAAFQNINISREQLFSIAESL